MKIASILVTLAMVGLAQLANAGDLGFRYSNGSCVNAQGVKGLNPSYFGQCADFKGAVLGKLNLDGIDFSGSQFAGADLQKSSFKQSKMVGVNFDGSNLAGVQFDSSTIQMVSFKQANLKNVSFADATMTQVDFTSVDFRGSQLSYLTCQNCLFGKANFSGVALDQVMLSGSDFTDALFVGANLDHANLTNATILNADFTQGNLTSTVLTGAKGGNNKFNSGNLTNTNLSGASIAASDFRSARAPNANLNNVNFAGSDVRSADMSTVTYTNTKWTNNKYNKRSLLPFSADQAKTYGMVFQKAGSVLILWDTMSQEIKNFAAALISEYQMEVTLAAASETAFDGTTPLTAYDTIIHLDGLTYNVDMPQAGQKALVDFVNNGGLFIYGEWVAYEFSNGRMQFMPDLILMTTNMTTAATITVTPTTAGKSSPIMEGFTAAFNLGTQVGFNGGKAKTFTSNPVTVLAADQNGNDSIMTRAVGKGRVVAFSFTCTYSTQCMNDANVKKLYANAINGAL